MGEKKRKRKGGVGAVATGNNVVPLGSLVPPRAAFNYARVRCNEANCFLLSIKVKFSL